MVILTVGRSIVFEQVHLLGETVEGASKRGTEPAQVSAAMMCVDVIGKG